MHRIGILERKVVNFCYISRTIVWKYINSASQTSLRGYLFMCRVSSFAMGKGGRPFPHCKTGRGGIQFGQVTSDVVRCMSVTQFIEVGHIASFEYIFSP